MSPLRYDDLDLDPDLDRLAHDLARQLAEAGSTMDVPVAPFASTGSLRPSDLELHRRLRARPLVAAAAAVAVIGAGVLVTRSNEVADLPVATGPETSVPASVPAPATVPVGWRMLLDPATGFHPTSATDTCCLPPLPDPDQEPGYRDGMLYAQHWVAVYVRPDDPLGGPLLSVETDYQPVGGVPGALPSHPAPSFTIDTPHGPEPAWEWSSAPGVFRFGFLGDPEHPVTVGAFGMSREDAIAAVSGITIGPKGAAEMPEPPGLVGHRVYEPTSAATYTAYAESDDPEPLGPGHIAREVHVNVYQGATGPDLLEAASSFFQATGFAPTTGAEVERITVDGRAALLRRYGDGAGALLITYDPERRRTITVYGQGGVGDDEILALAGQLRDIDDAAWQDILDRCREAGTAGLTLC